MNIFSKFLLFGLLISFLISCTQSSVCLTPQIIAMRGGFYQKDTTTSFKDTILENAMIFFGNDTLYYQNVRNSSKFSFPLSQTEDKSTFYFFADSTNLNSNSLDTITLFHQRNLHFISVACGYQTHFTIDSIHYSQFSIDTAFIENATVSNEANNEHIKVVVKN